jgi:membrane associated rhomboid family serine protease/Zn-finger nucleic acid-binding protein
MAEIDRGGVKIDRCDSCGGVWFDAGELNEYLSDAIASDPEIPDAPFTPDGPSGYSAPESRRSELDCPRCRAKLTRFNFAYDSGVILERCPICSGLWVERGKLRNLAAHVKGNPSTRAVGRFLAEHHKEVETWRSLGDAARSSATRAGILHLGLGAILPLGTERRDARTPWALISIIALQTLVFGFQALTGSISSMASAGGFVPAELFSGRDLHTLLTSGFIHSDFFHLAGNMLFLWVFGRSLEGRLGPLKFLGLYAALEISSNLIYGLIHHDSPVPAIGASGAVSGLMGAFWVLFPRDRIKTFFVFRMIQVPAWIYLGLWIAYQLLNGLIYSSTDTGGVAWFAHIGGFAAGAGAMIPLRLREKTARSPGDLAQIGQRDEI